jgi:hypothetical protein
MTPPPDTAPPIVWAVALGCHNGKRLSAEWGIPLARACSLLTHAHRDGHLCRIARGLYVPATKETACAP